MLLGIDQAVDAFDFRLGRERHTGREDRIVNCRNGWWLVFQSDAVADALRWMIRIVPPLGMLAQALLGIFEQLTHRNARLHAFNNSAKYIPHPIVLGLLAW